MEHNDRWIQIRFEELEKRLDQAFTLRDKAADNSKSELRDRLEKMNEIREQLDRQAKTFADKGWVESQFEARGYRLSSLERSMIKIETRASELERLGDKRLYIMGLVVAVMQIITFVAIRLME